MGDAEENRSLAALVTTTYLDRLGGGLFFDVAVEDFGGDVAGSQGFLDGFGHHDGAVFPSGAAEGNGQVAFAFLNIMRDQVGEQAFDATEKFAGLRERADVTADFGVFTGEGTKTRDEVGIRKEADVED